MAILINLGIDCGKSEEVADRIVNHFQGYRFKLIDVGEVESEIWKKKNKICGYWCIGVWPIGLGCGTRTKYEADLMEYQEAIGSNLYSHLALIRGYRKALFGGEIFDMWKDRDEEQEEMIINEPIYWEEMTIYAEAEFPSLTEDLVYKSPFIPGYAVYHRHYTEQELERNRYYASLQ
jgi:hypothetical protein